MERIRPYLKSFSGLFVGVLLLLLLLFGLTRSGVTLLKELRAEDARVAEAQIAVKIEDLHFYGAARRIAYAGFLSVAAVALSALSLGLYRRLSVQTFKLGEHREIKVKYADMSRVGYIAEGLVVAEQLASKAHSQEQAFQIYLQINKAITRQLNTQRPAAAAWLPQQDALPSPAARVPSFAELLQQGEIAPGKPLICGYEAGVPQYRQMQVFKSMAIAGHQGSGKTRSTAYLIACAALCCDAQIIVCDPHGNHDESLRGLIHPLETIERVTVMNPFELPKLVRRLDGTLDRRLAGTESSEQPILFVIDELARLAKLEIFDEILTFIERCTEETRKANITFFGGSPKWTARHFKGRADIRGCMNSMLIHKTKPSQAEMLLEDTQDRKLVKCLKKPGDAILVTDFGDPHIVSMPLTERADMQGVANKIGQTRPAIAVRSQEIRPKQEDPPLCSTELDAELENMLALPETETETLSDLSTDALLRTRTKELLKQSRISYGKIQDNTGIAKSSANGFVNAGKTLKPGQQNALRNYLERLEREPKALANAA